MCHRFTSIYSRYFRFFHIIYITILNKHSFGRLLLRIHQHGMEDAVEVVGGEVLPHILPPELKEFDVAVGRRGARNQFYFNRLLRERRSPSVYRSSARLRAACRCDSFQPLRLSARFCERTRFSSSCLRVVSAAARFDFK